MQTVIVGLVASLLGVSIKHVIIFVTITSYNTTLEATPTHIEFL